MKRQIDVLIVRDDVCCMVYTWHVRLFLVENWMSKSLFTKVVADLKIKYCKTIATDRECGSV